MGTGAAAAALEDEEPAIGDDHPVLAPPLEDQRDVVLFLLEESLTAPVMDAVHQAGRFDQPGTGIAFVLDVESVMGLESQLTSLKG